MTIATTEFEIQSVNFTSERIKPRGIELRGIVTDIDIYEDLRKPYITANIVLLDDSSFISGVNILGGEKIDIAIKSSKDRSRVIKKSFYIHKITNQKRVNENSQVVVLHLVEDCYYIACLANINRFYEGKGSEIIEKITKEFLGKELVKDTNETQKLKLIVPNLNPLQAGEWIKNNLTTDEGYPYYFYSTFVGDKLVLKDLKTLLTENSINSSKDLHYIWSQMNHGSMNPSIARKIIKQFKIVPGEDLNKLIANGLIGSKFSYINTALDKKDKITFDYDVVKDLLKPALGTVFNGNNKNPNYSPEYKHDNKPFNEIQSRHIALMGGSNPYRVTSLPDDEKEIPQYPLTIGEAYDEATYKQYVTSVSVDNLMLKSPIEIAVNGYDFIDGNKHSTIGNQLTCKFKKSNLGENAEQEDSKLSGDYLIYRARHLITTETYNISMKMAKMGNQ